MYRSMLALVAVVTACAPQDQAATTVTTALPPTEATTTTVAAITTAPVPATSPATTTTTIPPLQGLSYEEVASMRFPTVMAAGHGSTYLGLKEGVVLRLGEADFIPVLDISRLVQDQGERGFLGMDIHPDDPALLYVHYSAADGATTVAEYDISEPLPDPGSGRVVFQHPQPASNHNGGMLGFGPDGALFLALGDGGGAGDPFEHGQNRDTLLGGLVRLDPEGEAEPTLHAYGLRNPWRFWIDDGLIYIADVGQNRVEEVNVVPIGEPDHNFGWPDMEGDECFAVADCDPANYTSPVVTYRNPAVGCSVTGGVVYRGASIPELQGHYFYSDYCAGWLRSFRFDGTEATDQMDWTDDVGVPGRVVSFGVDADAEMYVMTETALLRVVPVR